ncbi:MAG: PASTA domain-containing protein, partial [Desulfosporosinus sp.]
LGIVLYELITGKVPYDGETPITIVLKHLQEQPVLPSKINPRIDQEFEAVIMRAIAKSPEQRYISAKDLLADLNHIQAGRPITRMAIPLLNDSEATQTHIGMGEILAPIVALDSSTKGESSPAKTENKKRRRWIVGGLVLIFLLLSLAGGLALQSFLAVGSTKVPDVVGKTVPDAGVYMKQAKLSLDPNVTFEFSDTTEKDHIIEQEPKAETSVKIGRAVKLVVSKGLEMAKFPDVTTGQMSKENALNLINNLGFIGKQTFDTKPSDTVPKGFVIAQDPAPNATWAKSGSIKLTISDGALQQTIYMPNVIGKTSTEAKKVLEDNKLVVHIENEDSTTFPGDVVMRTTPKPGDSVQQGTEVTMFISVGPGPLAMTDVRSQRSEA